MACFEGGAISNKSRCYQLKGPGGAHAVAGVHMHAGNLKISASSGQAGWGNQHAVYRCMGCPVWIVEAVVPTWTTEIRWISQGVRAGAGRGASTCRM